MATVTLKCLMARSKERLGVTDGAGRAGLAKQVDRVRSLGGRLDKPFLLSLSSTVVLVIDPMTLRADHLMTTAGLEAAHREKGRTFLESLQSAGISCLALPGIDEIPDAVVRFAERTSTFVFSSSFDETFLTSRLSGLLREKLHGHLLMHGALVNVCGRGVLITGESGVGKTTLALELAGRGHQWIADDAVEIEKRQGTRLYGRSQAVVKNLLEIKEIGVLPVRALLPAASIGDEISVDLVAQVSKSVRPCGSQPHAGRSACRIMGVRLPVLNISWSNDRGGQLERAVNIIKQAG